MLAEWLRYRNRERDQRLAYLIRENVKRDAQIENATERDRTAEAKIAILRKKTAIVREMKDRDDPDLVRQMEALDRELADLHNPGIRPREHDHFLLSDVPEGAPTFAGTDIPVQYMLDYLEHTRSIYGFLQDFPEVSLPEAIGAMRDHVRAEILDLVRSNPTREDGAPIFWGSDASMRDLFEQLADRVPEDRYPSPSSPSRRKAIRTLQMASLLMEAMVYETSVARSSHSGR